MWENYMLNAGNKYLRIFGCDNELRSWISCRKLFRFDGWEFVFNTITSPVAVCMAYNVQQSTCKQYTVKWLQIICTTDDEQWLMEVTYWSAADLPIKATWWCLRDDDNNDDDENYSPWSPPSTKQIYPISKYWYVIEWCDVSYNSSETHQ